MPTGEKYSQEGRYVEAVSVYELTGVSVSSYSQRITFNMMFQFIGLQQGGGYSKQATW